MKYNTKSITLKVNSVHLLPPMPNSTTVYSEELTKRKAESLAVLVSEEYNAYARHVDHDKVLILQESFNTLLSDMVHLMNS
jgi:hypothetical protein